MDMTDYVKEFRALQKTQKIRVADFCRERMLDYYIFRSIPVQHSGAAVSSKKDKEEGKGNTTLLGG